ncbi:MAG: KpsF/GutQ family sugar-phosphate isomerase [Pseudomonadota bacterium]
MADATWKKPGTPEERDRALAAGRRVLALEGEALSTFGRSLDDSFADAVDLIMGVQGRVVVSGMGKSGHVARKIAATFASTGTPAQFVHPAEASHGDLGMVTPTDVALVLSNSGETKELADIVAHTRRFSIPLIGVASRPGSTLLRQADIALVLPHAMEAGPEGAQAVAPTTSTTLTMALGDALAMALMERREFTLDRFRTFHPGGKLGAQLVNVSDIMGGPDRLPLVAPETPMAETLIVMSEKGYGCAGVVDPRGRLVGVITDGDLRRQLDGLMEKRAGEIATPNPRTIAPDRLAQEAVAEMSGRGRQRKVTFLFVTEPNRPDLPVGILHLHDCLRAGVEAAG